MTVSIMRRSGRLSYDSQQYVQESGTEVMMDGSMCRRGVHKV